MVTLKYIYFMKSIYILDELRINPTKGYFLRKATHIII